MYPRRVNVVSAVILIASLALGRAFGADQPENWRSPESWQSRERLAWDLLDQNKLAKAEQEFRAVIAILGSVRGAEHPSTLRIRDALALALSSQDKNAEAEQEIRAVLKIRERSQGPEAPDFFQSCCNLGHHLATQGKLREALVLMQRGSQGLAKTRGADYVFSEFAKAECERIEAKLKKKQAQKRGK